MTVYYLGAGASANSIPIISEIYVKLKEAIKLLESSKLSILEKNPEFSDNYQRLLNIWKEIQEKLPRYPTIDTVLYNLQFDPDPNRFYYGKLALECLFSFWEWKSHVDIRYKGLIASFYRLINSNKQLHKPITIISWNYDIQVERSLCYTLNIKLNEIENYINRDPKNLSRNKLNLIKLNGTIDLYQESHFRKRSETSLINAFNHFVKKIEVNSPSTIRFAWENAEKQAEISILAGQIRRCTSIVFLGYSFPNFNAEYDVKLIRNIEAKRIVLQTKIDQNRLAHPQLISELSKLKSILPPLYFKHDLFQIDYDISSFHVPIE